MSRITKTLVLAACGTLSVAAALPPEARLDRMLEGRVAGRPVDCINLRDIRSSQIIDGTAIVYQVGGKLYVNRPRGGASSLDRDDILVTNTVTSQLCSIDVVHLVDRTSRFQTGFVQLGEFVPYAKPKR
ncbi:MAG: hypothetical protein JSS55_02930 [Proteobacteria bacterium]|nr:hypothetical protein [Pseudomonadota bacterium]